MKYGDGPSYVSPVFPIESDNNIWLEDCRNRSPETENIIELQVYVCSRWSFYRSSVKASQLSINGGNWCPICIYSLPGEHRIYPFP